MNASARRLKTFWTIAVAIAAMLGVFWVSGGHNRSDSRGVRPVPSVDTSPVVGRTGPEPETSPAPVEARPPGRGATRVVTVEFPNGASITVPLRVMPHPGVRLEGGLTTLTDFYRQLAHRARAGDAAAAFELARKLEQCRRLLATEAAVEPASGQQPADPKWLDFCRGTADSMLDEAAMWRQQAVDAGYYFAMQDQARELRGTPRELEIWESLWQRGHANALQLLKIRYSQGVAGSPPDYVRAYAYTLIYFGLMQAAFQDLQSQTPTQKYMLFTVEESLRQAGSYLTPGETETAITLAIELLKKNPNCCIGRWG